MKMAPLLPRKILNRCKSLSDLLPAKSLRRWTRKYGLIGTTPTTRKSSCRLLRLLISAVLLSQVLARPLQQDMYYQLPQCLLLLEPDQRMLSTPRIQMKESPLSRRTRLHLAALLKVLQLKLQFLVLLMHRRLIPWMIIKLFNLIDAVVSGFFRCNFFILVMACF